MHRRVGLSIYTHVGMKYDHCNALCMQSEGAFAGLTGIWMRRLNVAELRAESGQCAENAHIALRAIARDAGGQTAGSLRVVGCSCFSRYGLIARLRTDINRLALDSSHRRVHVAVGRKSGRLPLSLTIHNLHRCSICAALVMIVYCCISWQQAQALHRPACAMAG